MAETFILKKYGNPPKTLKVEICDDGSLKIDATGMPGTAEDIMKELEALAVVAGGEKQALVIEKHVHGAHTHTHTADHVHQH